MECILLKYHDPNCLTLYLDLEIEYDRQFFIEEYFESTKGFDITYKNIMNPGMETVINNNVGDLVFHLLYKFRSPSLAIQLLNINSLIADYMLKRDQSNVDLYTQLRNILFNYGIKKSHKR